MANKDIEERLRGKVSFLPDLPGVYRFLNHEGVVIYVGKAKNLKRRVSSYFLSKSSHGSKVLAMVRNIFDIEHIVVSTESEALLLENNMIKSLQPRYNILLKDDKTFPWIAITNEHYPRVISTRRLTRDGSQYFGPYASVPMQRSVLDLARKLYFVRTCRLNLREDLIKSGRFSKCLEYHIGNCKAPCEGYQTKEEYNEGIAMVYSILKGNMKGAKEYLLGGMNRAVENLKFEEAQRFKDRLAMLDRYESHSVIVSPQYTDMDIFSPIIDDNAAYCNYMHVAKGAVINSYSIEMKLGIEDSKEDILSFAIISICESIDVKLSNEVIVPFIPSDIYDDKIRFSVPKRGDKLKLLELSQKNCKIFRLEKHKQIEKVNPQRHTERIMEAMRKNLNMGSQPRHIECFDNSNIQGAYPVSACVVFRDGKPSKKEYRHFNIKSVEGIDDFASMRETLFRRYSRLLKENGDLPQLIVIDGGKGQLGMAYGVIKELGLENKITIIGLAKRMEEIFFPNESFPYHLDKSSETLKVLMHIRDEAHRFGITFHRNKRSLGAIKSEIEDIPSLGDKSVMKLLKHYKTVSKIRGASLDDLANLVGMKRALAIKEYFEVDLDKK